MARERDRMMREQLEMRNWETRQRGFLSQKQVEMQQLQQINGFTQQAAQVQMAESELQRRVQQDEQVTRFATALPKITNKQELDQLVADNPHVLRDPGTRQMYMQERDVLLQKDQLKQPAIFRDLMRMGAKREDLDKLVNEDGSLDHAGIGEMERGFLLKEQEKEQQRITSDTTLRDYVKTVGEYEALPDLISNVEAELAQRKEQLKNTKEDALKPDIKGKISDLEVERSKLNRDEIKLRKKAEAYQKSYPDLFQSKTDEQPNPSKTPADKQPATPPAGTEGMRKYSSKQLSEKKGIDMPPGIYEDPDGKQFLVVD